MGPVFADNIIPSDHTPLEVVSGPASRNAKIAAAGTRAEFFQYSFDDRLGNKTVMSEFGVLPLIYDLSMITKLTTSTGE